MAKNIDIHFALEVIFRDPFAVFHQYLIGDGQAVKDFIRLEKTSVVSEYFIVLALEACVHVAEVFLQAVVERLVFVQFLQLFPLIDDHHDRIGRQQSSVFCEEDEEQPIEQLLGFLEE